METLDLYKKLNDVSKIQFINTHILIFRRCIAPSVHATPPLSPTDMLLPNKSKFQIPEHSKEAGTRCVYGDRSLITDLDCTSKILLNCASSFDNLAQLLCSYRAIRLDMSQNTLCF